MLQPLAPQPHDKKFTTVWISPMGIRFAKYETADEALLDRGHAPNDWNSLGLPRGQNVTAFVLDDKFAQVGSTYIYPLHKTIVFTGKGDGTCQQ